jgi:hypothetical protein
LVGRAFLGSFWRWPGLLASWCFSVAPVGLSQLASTRIDGGSKPKVRWWQAHSIRRLGAGDWREICSFFALLGRPWWRGRMVWRWSTWFARFPDRPWRRGGSSSHIALFSFSSICWCYPSRGGLPLLLALVSMLVALSVHFGSVVSWRNIWVDLCGDPAYHCML